MIAAGQDNTVAPPTEPQRAHDLGQHRKSGTRGEMCIGGFASVEYDLHKPCPLMVIIATIQRGKVMTSL